MLITEFKLIKTTCLKSVLYHAAASDIWNVNSSEIWKLLFIFLVVKISTHKANVNFFNFSNKDYNVKQFFGDMRPI
jgi:hypothetical protein